MPTGRLSADDLDRSPSRAREPIHGRTYRTRAGGSAAATRSRMKRRIFGLEHEYGVGSTMVSPKSGSPICITDIVASYLFGRAPRNAFLENGARLYLDGGFHPEYATAECDDLLGLLHQDAAGRAIVDSMAREAEQRMREAGWRGDILLFRNNTDFTGNTYGCHENYLVDRACCFGRLADALTPFLVTRQVFAGAGKVLRTSTGFRYCLSQRAQHVSSVISGSTRTSRSIIDSRDEPHADARRFRRLHLILGDSNMSEVATYLKCGTTALVLDMIEDGFLDRDYSLDSPVRALWDVSKDISLRTLLRLKDGRTITALEIQETYLDQVSRYLDTVGADAATTHLLAVWRHTLKWLARDPMRLARTLDWVAKLRLIERTMARRSLSWEDAQVSRMDLAYHDIGREHTLYHGLLSRGLMARVTSDREVDRARVTAPQSTRARLRGEFVRQAKLKGRDYRVDWTYLRLEGENEWTVHCPDPFVAHNDEAQRLIEAL